MNDSVASDALVMPSRIGSIVNGSLPLRFELFAYFQGTRPVNLLATKEAAVADRFHQDFAQHLANDDLYMLVVDLHTPCRR